MQISNNNLPPIVQVASVTERQFIPSNFVQLVSQERNNIGSTNKFGKPGYERYFFFSENECYYLDINSKIMDKLGLQSSQECDKLIYADKRALSRTPEHGGITINNSEDLILVEPGTLLEREVQTELTEQIINTLENNLTAQARNIQELNERINTLQETNTQLETNQAILTQEKNELTGQIQARENRIGELEVQNNILQISLTNEQEAHQNTKVGSIILQIAIAALQNQINNLVIERDSRPNISLENHNNLIAQRNIFRNRY